MDDRAKLLLLTDFIGPAYGTEDFSLFLYSLVRLQTPQTIVELGTGLGTSSFWMALALRVNNLGHLWTVDNGDTSAKHPSILRKVLEYLAANGLSHVDLDLDEKGYLEFVAKDLNILSHITFIRESIDLNDPQHFTSYPFHGHPVDLLFSDFQHGVSDILSIMAQWLPQMAQSSSIFIDSASTAWPSYLLLEQLVHLFNKGKVPLELQRRCNTNLDQMVRSSRFTLIHLTEAKDRPQNSTAWLKIEPVDLVPHPRSAMRGMLT